MNIRILLNDGVEVEVTLVSASSNDPIKVLEEADALEQNEASTQVVEGGSYEYKIDQDYFLQEISGIVSTSKLNKQTGRITPNIFVGTLPIDIISSNTLEKVGVLWLEVQSTKATYRDDYRRMLEEIAEKCTDLLMQHSSPVVQTFTVDLEKDSETAYQRFAFIKSVIDSEEFDSAFQKIVSAPTTKWRTLLANKPVQAIRKVDRKIARQFASSTRRITVPLDHPLSNIVSSLPETIQYASKEETVDTPENRFIRFALESFLQLCSDFSHLTTGSRVKKEALILEEKLDQYLSHSLFKEISTLSSVPLNSPVLQRKEGYREIYRAWILFDLAAKLTWKGGEDVYYGNKRDVAILYEYWLFFKLVEVVTEVFDIKPPQPEELIEETFDGFGLKLKQGEYLPIKGLCDTGSRKLYVQLSYNRTYRGDQDFPDAGSWTRNLRPDYTLTIWPYGIDEEQAEKEELIVHIHFDAKYKVEKFQEIFSSNIQLDDEKIEQRKGTYQRGDLLKMHAYKDAIRRTAGAYVLYPGNDVPKTKKGFHEIVPGLGAFAIRPSRVDNGIEELKAFLVDVTNHLMNRASQRERINFKSFEVYSQEQNNELHEALPEAFGKNRSLIPDETFVLVGFYKSQQHLDWILSKGFYNARAENNRGSLRLGPQEAGAKYLLIRTEKENTTDKLFKIIETGPRVFSKQTLIKKGYPSEPTEEYYLIYKVEKVTDVEFLGRKWDVRKLEGYRPGRNVGLPFSVSLTDLMMVIE